MGKGGTASATPSVIVNAFLFQHNASVNGGVTTRWSSLPITVNAEDIATAESQFNRWRDVTGGAVTFSFVGSGGGVQVREGEADPDICAFTVVFFTPAGLIVLAEVTLAPIWNTGACMDTIAHEAGHAIGFLGHSADGGLMDPDGGNGEITGQVADMIKTLYAHPPGTMVKAAQVAKRASTAKGGLQRTTFVTPARRP